MDTEDFNQQLVFKVGVKIFNDSASVTPQQTINSLKQFNNCILIVGGEKSKQQHLEELADAIDKKVKAVYFLEGEVTEQLKNHIKHLKILRSTYSDLTELLKDVKIAAKAGDIILFSPGATSFNLFPNEFDRGRKFNAAVEKIFGELEQKTSG